MCSLVAISLSVFSVLVHANSSSFWQKHIKGIDEVGPLDSQFVDRSLLAFRSHKADLDNTMLLKGRKEFLSTRCRCGEGQERIADSCSFCNVGRARRTERAPGYAFGLPFLLCWLYFLPTPLLLQPSFAQYEIAAAARQNLLPASDCNGLFFATFNIQNLGVSKGSRSEVLKALATIIARYDVVALEELSQKPSGSGVCGTNTMSTICDLRQQVSAISGRDFAAATSPRIGDEQYALLFDSARVSLDGSATYPDFEATHARPPHAFRIQVGSKKVSVVVAHTNPKRATAEIQDFPAVLEWTKVALPADFTMLAGDFNADGSYFKERSEWPSVLDRMPGFSLRVPNELDTTVATSSNTYDRIIASSQFQAAPAEVFAIDQHIDLSPVWEQGCKDGYVKESVCKDVDWVEVTKELSDHYPVEMCIDPLNVPGIPARSVSGTRRVAARAVQKLNPASFGRTWLHMRRLTTTKLTRSE